MYQTCGFIKAETPLYKEVGVVNKAAPEVSLYYFHPDHLGTATFLTDNFGNPYQLFLNLPFGEAMAEQRQVVKKPIFF